MFIPKCFEVTDRKEILDFVKHHAFGQLVSSVEGRLFSSHLPFFVSDDEQSIVCHVSKRNIQWESIEGQEVLVTFQGAHGYISPSWYKTPGVPTWNYQAVHVYGKPALIFGKEKLSEIVGKLTSIYESSFEEPWCPEYKDSLLDAIIGIEIKITDMQCKYKLSQNRSVDDQKNVVEELKNKNAVQLVCVMKKKL